MRLDKSAHTIYLQAWEKDGNKYIDVLFDDARMVKE